MKELGKQNQVLKARVDVAESKIGLLVQKLDDEK